LRLYFFYVTEMLQHREDAIPPLLPPALAATADRFLLRCGRYVARPIALSAGYTSPPIRTR